MRNGERTTGGGDGDSIEALLEEAERLLAAITPGDWRMPAKYGDYVESARFDPVARVRGASAAEARANAEFIAAAPRLVRDLLETIAQLRASIADAQARAGRILSELDQQLPEIGP